MLKKNVPVVLPPWKIDPDLPISELQRFHPPLPPEGAPVRTLPPMEFRPVPVPNPTPAPPPVMHPNPLQDPNKPKP